VTLWEAPPFALPVLLTTAVAIVRWKRLSSRVAFFVVGILTCAGLFRILSWGTRYFFWKYGNSVSLSPDPVTPATAIGLAIVGLVLSAVLLFWLATLSLTPNNRWRGP
jgi:hypothetical protein